MTYRAIDHQRSVPPNSTGRKWEDWIPHVLKTQLARIITPAELKQWHLDNQQRAHMSPAEKRANSPGRKAA